MKIYKDTGKKDDLKKKKTALVAMLCKTFTIRIFYFTLNVLEKNILLKHDLIADMKNTILMR